MTQRRMGELESTLGAAPHIQIFCFFATACALDTADGVRDYARERACGRLWHASRSHQSARATQPPRSFSSHWGVLTISSSRWSLSQASKLSCEAFIDASQRVIGFHFGALVTPSACAAEMPQVKGGKAIASWVSTIAAPSPLRYL